METNLEKGCAEKIVELTGFGRLHVNDILPDIKEATRQAYLQGIRDAKGCVGEKKWISIEHQKFLEEVGELKETRAEVRGMNMRRSETLEAITRLEEGTDV